MLERERLHADVAAFEHDGFHRHARNFTATGGACQRAALRQPWDLQGAALPQRDRGRKIRAVKGESTADRWRALKVFLSRWWIFFVAFSMDAGLGAEPAAARDCTAATEAAACVSNEDCACGTNTATGQCDVAVSECVSGDACERFCSGYGSDLRAVCRQGRCTRARRTRCPGDCDGDVSVHVAELVTGVGIVLGARPVAACENLDQDGDGDARVDEMITAVRAALGGCAAALPASPGARGVYDGLVTAGSDTGE